MSDNIEQEISNDLEIAKLRKQLIASYSGYKQTLKYLACDAPIETLCLPKSMETILITQGFLRIYDLLDGNMDFTKIKGFGIIRSRDLASRLDQFLAMF